MPKKSVKKKVAKKSTKKSVKKTAKKTVKKTAKKTVKKAVKKTAKGKYPSVTVYSTPTCPYCNAAKEYLKSNGVAYKNIDVSKDQNKAQEMIEKSGQMGVPVLDIGGQIIIGFDRDAIKKALRL